jgi:hypothetical protein
LADSDPDYWLKPGDFENLPNPSDPDTMGKWRVDSLPGMGASCPWQKISFRKRLF